MKKSVKIARITVIFIFMIGLTYFGYTRLNHLLTPTIFSLTDDKIISKEGCEAISEFIKEGDYSNSSLKSIAQQLKKKFTHINHVSVILIPKKLVIDIQSYKPRFVVNNEFILLDSGMLAPIKLFNKEVVSTIPSVKLNQLMCNSGCLTERCFNCLDTVSRALFEEYDCSWEHEQEVWLANKKQPRFVVLADSNSLNNCKKLLKCAAVKTDIESRKTFLREKSTEWVADIRFDNQVIIFSRGGKGHGYTTCT